MRPGRPKVAGVELGGVTEAACKGAQASAAYAAGDTVGILPGYDPREANPYVDVILASELDHLRNSVVAHAEAVVAIGGGAGTLSEICFAWMHKRLIVALRVSGWGGKLAGLRLDERVRYPRLPDDRIYGADDASEAVRLVMRHLGAYGAHHQGIRRRKNTILRN
jgi:uncharacterized protein (TIGR00725 family)